MVVDNYIRMMYYRSMPTATPTIENGRYGAVTVRLERSEKLPERYYVKSTTLTRRDMEQAYCHDEAYTLGWVHRDSTGRWSARVANFAANRTNDVHDVYGHEVAVDCRTRLEAVEAVVWHIACRGRTWIVSDVR